MAEREMKPKSRMTLWKRIFGRKDSETITLLKSIDSRLSKLESCIVKRVGIPNSPPITYISTGAWND